ncbi:PaaI family thioesterase [uncultured Piscinibacter sp.]|uniref:PaaI family thioesterase n=1 Tax=uncultured Piscinibacter sp. TaxID=1131835 RepID=UPI0026356AC9|nr:PaaI family thioesterase [uncultured Piscinibacter sp.]
MSTPAIPAGFAPLTLGGEFIVANGPLFERCEGEAYQLGFRVEKRHTNTMGICHGGMMATFCDMLLPITAFRRNNGLRARFLPTVSLDIDYLAPAPLGAWVQGEAQVLRTTRSMVFAQGLVSADGEPVARVSGVFKIGAAFAAALAEGGAAG